MKTTIKNICLVSLPAIALVSCATNERVAKQFATLDDAQVSARQGEEVEQICLRDELDTFDVINDDAIAVRRKPGEWYMLKVSGPSCTTEFARRSPRDLIAIDGEGGAGRCVRKQSNVSTDLIFCDIDGIYKWDNSGDGRRF